jgi:hypothetical protein
MRVAAGRAVIPGSNFLTLTVIKSKFTLPWTRLAKTGKAVLQTSGGAQLPWKRRLPIHYPGPNIAKFALKRLARLAGLVSAMDALVISGGISTKSAPIILAHGTTETIDN